MHACLYLIGKNCRPAWLKVILYLKYERRTKYMDCSTASKYDKLFLLCSLLNEKATVIEYMKVILKYGKNYIFNLLCSF